MLKHFTLGVAVTASIASTVKRIRMGITNCQENKSVVIAFWKIYGSDVPHLIEICSFGFSNGTLFTSSSDEPLGF